MALWQALGGISGATSIIAGAYGAHGLASRSMPQGSPPPVTGAPLSPEQRDKVWQRAVSYQQLHSLALLLVPVLTPAGSATQLVAGASFSSGILLFSGGCYGYALTGDKSVSSMAPFGGTAFVLGWLALAIAARGRVRAPAALASKGT